MSTGGGGSGGGGDHVGGIEATVALDTSGIDPGLAALQAKLADVGGRLEALGPKSATATTAVAANMNQVGQSAAAAGFRMQTFAQTLDDLQYVGEMGLRPILNNLIQISPALGVAALAVDQLVKQMGGWAEVLSDLGVISPIETAAAEMKRLGDQTERTANEQDRLNRLKKGEAAVESARTGETKEEKAAAGAVQEAIAAADFRKVRDMVMRAQPAPTMSPEDVAALERERAFGANPFAKVPGGLFGYGVKEQIGMGENIARGYGKDARKTIEDRLAREANAAAERLIGEAKLPGAAGESARGQLAKYAREAGGDFGGFAAAIEEGSPAALRNRGIDEETDKRRKILDKAREKDRADLLAAEQADALENEANAEKYARDKVKNRRRLTEGEREAATEETRQAEREMIRDEGERGGAHAGRLNVLNRRLKEAVRGEPRESKVMDASQLWASVQASVTNAPSREEKKMEEVRKINEDIYKEIAKFNRPVKAGGR